MFTDQQVPSAALCLNEQEFYNNYCGGGYYNMQYQQHYPYDLSSSNWMVRSQPLDQAIHSDSSTTYEQYQQQQEQFNFYYNQMQQHYFWNTQSEHTDVKPLVVPPAPRPSAAPSPGAKRKRTCFSTGQLMELEQTFQLTPYISTAQRRQMAERLQLEEKSIKCWFQNRRMRQKKDRVQMMSAASSPTSTTSTASDNEDLVRRLLKHAVKRDGVFPPGSPEGGRFSECPVDTSTDTFGTITDGEDAESVDNILHDESFYQ